MTNFKVQTRTRGFWFFKKTEYRYAVNVKLYDTYDFNKGDETGDGLGSILNNFGYKLQEMGIGETFYWELNYVYTTKWDTK